MFSTRHRIDLGAVLGTILVSLVLAAAILAPLLTPHDPAKTNLSRRLVGPTWTASPTHPEHPLGTDALGRDLFSRILYGSRASLTIGLVATSVAAVVGITLGLVSGYYGGWIDKVLMRLADIQLAFPGILLALAILAVLGPSTVNLVVVLALSHWVTFARLVRGEVLSLKSRDFVLSAVAIGASDLRIMLRQLMPNLVTSLTVIFTVSLTRLIIAESSLSFLGFGVQPPTPTWGGMLGDGRSYLARAWWVSTLPGVALMITVLGINLVGDWLRDKFDPRLRKQR
jgi:peptide/nickel transport system permease protein